MEGTTSIFDGAITSATLQPVLDGIKELLPVVIPVAVGFLAFRKGWSFVMSTVKGA